MSDAFAYGLSRMTLDYLASVFRKHSQIQQVLIFGSRAQGTYTPYSDIDLAVCAPDLTAAEFAAIVQELADLPLIYKLDCLHLDTMRNSSFRNRIMETGKPFWGASVPNPTKKS